MVGLWESIPFSDPRWSIHFSNPISQPHKEGIVQAVDRVSDDSSEWGSTVDRKSLGGKIQVSKDGKQVIITTLPESDWWRTPEVDSASGLVWGYKRATGEGFEVQVDLKIDYEVQVSLKNLFLSKEFFCLPTAVTLLLSRTIHFFAP
ncbi:hypothetical protein M231_04512 [Tremella mesenterica]|uniref:Uncharacterized protein n=1 Tax=Tremella mesenterica TaxID=5217 RepID=A0A4Q1BKB8_TREME|nr:hypothetical protein M231_04512 [Tremella mesenterica]